MRNLVLSAITACLFATGPAAAFDISEMSDAERETFREEIRNYLLDNPEVIMEAVRVLEARQQQAQAAADKDFIAANASVIFNDDVSWVGGNPEGDVTVVEFMDYRCGYCRRAVPEVEARLETDGNIRLVLKEYPVLLDHKELLDL